MVLYNVTIVLEHKDLKDEWTQWMQRVHIPEVMATGLFLEYKMSQVLDERNPDGTTFAIQYLCKDMDTLKNYEQNHAPALQAKHTQRYSGKFGAFRTLLKVLDQG